MIKPRVVVCAAVLLVVENENYDSVVLLGPRHWDRSMGNQLACQEEVFEDADQTQGFIDQFGVFMDREEAWTVAEAAGQIKYPEGTHKQGVLFSENLY